MPAPTTPKILIVRHAEKPDATNQGVTVTGQPDPESLVVQGWQRAGGLAQLFAPRDPRYLVPGLAVPQFLFASGVAKHSHSLRPQETITPTSQKLGLTINTTFLKEQGPNMAAAATKYTGVVLIAWEHQDIPGIANVILGNSTTAPQKWPGDRFDLVWVFDLQPNGTYAFSQVPQLLLAGDKPKPIAR